MPRLGSGVPLVTGLVFLAGAWASGAPRADLDPPRPAAALPQVAQAGQRGQPVASAGTALLAGQVVEHPSGRGVAGASVTLLSRGRAAPGVSRGGVNPWAIAADSQGRFFFANLPAGPYTVQVTRSGYTALTTTSLARAYEVLDGERVTDLRIVLTKLALLAGTIRDDAGDPVVGTTVLAFRRGLVNGRRVLEVARGARSDDRGSYRIVGLTPGEYLVCACTRDPIPFDGVLLTTLAADPLQLMGAAARALTFGGDAASLDATLRTYAPTFHPNSATAAQAARVILAPGEEKAAVDVDVTPVRATRVSGAVTAALGPVQASELRLIPAAESGEGAALVVLQPALVQPDGRFDFVGVPPGEYVLRVRHTPTDGRSGGPSGAALAFIGARATQQDAAPGRQLPNEPLSWAAEPVSVGDEGVTGLTVALRPAASISGRVQFVGAAPPPTPEGLGRWGIITEVLSPDRTVLGSSNLGRVNPDATFRVTGSLPGSYALLPLGVLPGWNTLKSVVVAGADVTDLPLEIGVADVSDVVITFVDTPMATLSGTLAAGRNRPAAATTMLVFPTDQRYWMSPAASRRRFRAAPVSRAGSFTAGALPAGEYFVVALPDDLAIDWQETSRLEALSKSAQRIELRDGETKTLEVRR